MQILGTVQHAISDFTSITWTVDWH